MDEALIAYKRTTTRKNMNISEKEYYGLLLNRPDVLKLAREQMHSAWIDSYENTCAVFGDEGAEMLTAVCDNLFRGKSDSYLLSKSAKEVVEYILVKKDFDLTIIKQLHRKSVSILYSKDEFIRYDIFGDHMVMLCAEAGDGGQHRHSVFYIDLTKNMEQPAVWQSAEIQYSWLVRFVKAVLFLELTEPSFLFVPAGKKNSSRPIGYTNTSKSPVTVVTSTWNKYIVRGDGFGVSGHFRAQRVGVGRRDVRLVWVNPYHKNGYAKNPGSNNATDELSGA